MGIGPTICRSIIEFHQGRLWADRPMAAAPFRFTVPIEEEQRMQQRLQIIHVVDDDEAMRDSMTWLLEGEGYAGGLFRLGPKHSSAPGAATCAAASCSTCACRK